MTFLIQTLIYLNIVRQGRLMLLVKDSDQSVDTSNLRPIVIASAVYKLIEACMAFLISPKIWE